MSPKAVMRESQSWALFLDVDGTLLQIAETPQGVVVPETLKRALSQLSVQLDGALALVSGRSLADLDRLLAPMRFCASGVHGCERRESNGCVIRRTTDVQQLDRTRRELAEFARGHPGLLLEDKGCCLALHFRCVPHLGDEVRHRMAATCASCGPDFVLQEGKCVYEIRPADSSNAASVAAFMREAPFRDRRPVYVGDDVADEDAFKATNALNGVSIRVGDASDTLAQYRLAGVDEVIDWLQGIPLIVPPLGCDQVRTGAEQSILLTR